ncbi:MAG TPA: tRNA (adenosine(37)-N6)-dimethylallyltransferase MiaA [Candidatus Caenarcaniphilales bacterium]
MDQRFIEQAGLITICGPTATGKSKLALTLAQRLNSPILSADSRQVYQEFDVGTAKPTRQERQQVPHYLIDICSPQETMTVAQYQRQAQTWIAHFHQRSRAGTRVLPILVGGTGLYIRAVVENLQIPQVPPQAELRSQLQQLGQSQLYTWLQQVDPLSAQKIHPHDLVRTLRALEVFYVTGVPLSQQQGARSPGYPILQIGLDCLEPDSLTRRIQHRAEQMFTAGWLAEVETLQQKYSPQLSLFNTLGYREIAQHLAGEISLAQAQALTTLHTRQFAKRQRTWFRADPQIHWFDADHPALIDQVWEFVQRFLNALRTTPQT